MTQETTHSACPLDWPLDQPRTPGRADDPFGKHIGFARARDELLYELDLFGVFKSDIVLSSNVPLRQDGLPYADMREPEDPGVAVWFRRRDKPYVLACDRYRSCRANLRALQAVIDSLRRIERHGSPQLLERAFVGFKALPPALVTPAPPDWWEVLGVARAAAPDELKSAFRKRAHETHPDKGGSVEAFNRVMHAWSEAVAERRL